MDYGEGGGEIIITDSEAGLHLVVSYGFRGEGDLIVKNDELELNRGYSKKEEVW